MSVFFTATVACDGLDCFEAVVCEECRSEDEARKKAKKKGWVRRDDKDLCENCAAKS